MAELPFEIHCRVIDTLSSDPSPEAFSSLKAYGSTCAALLPPTQKHLYRKVNLWQPASGTNSRNVAQQIGRSYLLSNILGQSPAIGDYISILTIHLTFIKVTDVDNGNECRQQLDVSYKSLLQLTRVESLCIHGRDAPWTSISLRKDMRLAIEHLLGLSTITAVKLSCIKKLPFSLFGLFPGVRTLSLEHVTYGPSRPVHSPLSTTQIHPKTLILHNHSALVSEIKELCESRAIDFSSVDTLESEGGNAVSHQLKPLIEIGGCNPCEISFLGPSNVREGFALALNTHSRARLKHLVSRAIESNVHCGITEICQELEALTHGRRNMIEKITLIVTFITTSDNNPHQDAWKKLTQLLSDETAWPFFRLLKVDLVILRPGKTTTKGDWSSFPSTHLAALPAERLDFKWRVTTNPTCLIDRDWALKSRYS